MNKTQETLQLILAAKEDVQRAFTQPLTATSGLMEYDLEAPSKKLYPILTPLRNKIARKTGGKAIQSNWQIITGINTTNTRAGVSQGNRGAVINYATARYYAAFAGFGLENYVTFESDFASESFEDEKALAVVTLLQALMVQEELTDLGGNATQLIGGATLSLADVATGGLLAASTTYTVGCVPLTLMGYQQLAGINNGGIGFTANLVTGLLQQWTRTNTDGSSDVINGGTGLPSSTTQATASDGNATHCISASTPYVTGAVAYAWYIGASAALCALAGVSTINSYLFTTTTGIVGTNQLYSTLALTDYSANALDYDGMITQLTKGTTGGGPTGAYYMSLATGTVGTGTQLTTDYAGGITQITTAFQSFWNNYRLSPDEIYVNAQELITINNIVIKNGGAPLVRYLMDAGGGATLQAGIVVGSLLNKIVNKQVQVIVHPNMPPGTIMFWSNSVPYPLNNVGGVVLKHLRRDYYQVEWPRRTRKYEYGIYFDGVLKCYFPPAFGLITNIASGNA